MINKAAGSLQSLGNKFPENLRSWPKFFHQNSKIILALSKIVLKQREVFDNSFSNSFDIVSLLLSINETKNVCILEHNMGKRIMLGVDKLSTFVRMNYYIGNL